MIRICTLAVLFFGLSACGDSEPERPAGPVSLVAHDSWSLSAAGDDPFSATRDDYIPCDQTSVAREDIAGFDSVEVKTSPCNYITIQQPMRADLRTGDRVDLRIWHFFLDELPDAEAYVALQAGQQLLWEKYIPLPTDSGIHTDTITVEADVAIDAPVYFHIRNHGRNSWHLLEVDRL